MFLLDTNVVSELRKVKPHGGVLAWFTATPESDLFVSAVTLGEIQRGIELTRDQNPAKALEISQWADRLAATHNILPMDAPTFRVWARLMHRQSDALFEDAMIAATAQVHQLTVVTRNTHDFAAFKVPLHNPFE
jgi:toxin FitB